MSALLSHKIVSASLLGSMLYARIFCEQWKKREIRGAKIQRRGGGTQKSQFENVFGSSKSAH